MMIQEFNVFNQSGVIIPVDLSYPVDLFKNIDNHAYQAYFDGSNKGISWIRDGKRITLNDSHASINGFPSVNMDYIVAIYENPQGKYPPPRNAVIYNLDGSVHKVLQMPKLISKRLLEEIEKVKHSNPPVEALKYDKSTGLNFSGCGWSKDEHGVLFDAISIQYNRDYGEGRQLHPQTGEIGRLVDDWYNYY